MADMHDVYARDLDLNLLRVFAVVAEEGSVTRAAARLYVTQPAVSAAMRRLATFVGAELFTRQGHGLALTARGAQLAAAARSHLHSLVAATTAGAFDPKDSSATVRLGMPDGLEGVFVPALLRLLRDEAPGVRVVAVPVQFRTVESALLSGRVDMAISVADDLPRSIVRLELLPRRDARSAFVCLYDPRHVKLPKAPTEAEYFAQDHIAVSYAGDLRGIVEDAHHTPRRVRVAVATLSCVADIVDGSALVATIPSTLARRIAVTRPHLRTAPLPFKLPGARLELLWSRATDDDAVARFVRALLAQAARELVPAVAPVKRAARRPTR